MRRIRLQLAYDGTDFHGWQKQHPPDAMPLRTVQEVLEAALRRVLRADVSTQGASRTDAGVHARGQVVAFDYDGDLELEPMLCALNARLPDDVQVVEADLADEAFNPIADCTSKGYRYTLAHGCRDPRNRPLFDRRCVAVTPYTLDPTLMQEAAGQFVGEHDFAAFARINHGRETTVRRIDDCAVSEPSPGRITIDVSGSGFLWNMVRIIAGTLLEAGRGRIQPTDIPSIIASSDRANAGQTMPPEGLCLMWVRYD